MLRRIRIRAPTLQLKVEGNYIICLWVGRYEGIIVLKGLQSAPLGLLSPVRTGHSNSGLKH